MNQLRGLPLCTVSPIWLLERVSSLLSRHQIAGIFLLSDAAAGPPNVMHAEPSWQSVGKEMMTS